MHTIRSVENLHGDHAMAVLQKVSVIAILCVVAILLLFIHVRLHDYAYDDAYIHFRIATHLVDYGAPYYNPGESINASSSTGWTITLAMIIFLSRVIRISLDLPLAISTFNALLTLCGALTYTLLLIRLTHKNNRRALYGLFFVLYLAFTMLPSIGLMEIPMTLLLVGIALHLLLNNNRVCLVLFAVAIFFRLEFAMLFGLVVLLVLLHRRFSIWQILTYSAAGIAPFSIYQLFFFHSLLPNTIAAKSIVYSITFIDTLSTLGVSLTPNITLPFLDYTHPVWFAIIYVLTWFLLLASVVIFQVV
jgi:hypothetical protein